MRAVCGFYRTSPSSSLSSSEEDSCTPMTTQHCITSYTSNVREILASICGRKCGGKGSRAVTNYTVLHEYVFTRQRMMIEGGSGLAVFTRRSVSCWFTCNTSPPYATALFRHHTMTSLFLGFKQTLPSFFKGRIPSRRTRRTELESARLFTAAAVDRPLCSTHSTDR